MHMSNNTSNDNEIFANGEGEKLRGRIMRRVYLVWLIRKILSPVTAKVLILAGLARQLFIFVSVKDVMINAPSVYDLSASFQFFGNAFINTGNAVQLSLLTAILLSLWLTRDFVRVRAGGSMRT